MSRPDWHNKKFHDQFVNEKEEILIILGNGSGKATKGCTKGLVFSAQEQALGTNYITYHIGNTINSLLCRMCSEKRETVNNNNENKIK